MGWFHSISRVTSRIAHRVAAPVIHTAVSIPHHTASVFRHAVAPVRHVAPHIAHTVGAVAGKVIHESAKIKPVVNTAAKAIGTVYHDGVAAARANSPAGILRGGEKAAENIVGQLANSPFLWLGLAAGGFILLNQRR